MTDSLYFHCIIGYRQAEKISEISRKIEIFHVIKGIYLVILYFKDWFIGGVDRILTYLCFNFQASSSSENIAFSVLLIFLIQNFKKYYREQVNPFLKR